MANPVVHFEVGGPDAGALQSFYATTFGWTIDANNPMNYGMVTAEAGGIAGGVAPSPDGQKHITWYVGVDDLAATLKAIEKAGGKTAMPPMDVPGGPSIAQFTDPAGNLVGLVKNV